MKRKLKTKEHNIRFIFAGEWLIEYMVNYIICLGKIMSKNKN